MAVIAAPFRREFQHAVIRVRDAPGIIHGVSAPPEAFLALRVLQHLHGAGEAGAPEKETVHEIDAPLGIPPEGRHLLRGGIRAEPEHPDALPLPGSQHGPGSGEAPAVDIAEIDGPGLASHAAYGLFRVPHGLNPPGSPGCGRSSRCPASSP